MKTPLITTGGTGLVGSRVIELLSNYSVTNLDLRSSDPVDITNVKQVENALAQNQAEWVIHFAAFTDVTQAHKEMNDKSGITYHVNVKGTEAVIQACQATGKKLLHISTAYVFDGEKTEPYLEEDSPKPIEWYGTTKAIAEEKVISSKIDWTILRIDNPFRATPFAKPDLVARIVDKLLTNTLPPQFNDSQFGPTYIEDLARFIEWVISQQIFGIFHATNNESWSPFNFALEIAKKLNLKNSVKSGSLTEFLKITDRPYQRNTALNSNKIIHQSGLQPHSIIDALEEVEAFKGKSI